MTDYNASSEDVLMEVAKHMASAKCPECGSSKSSHVSKGTHKCEGCGKEFGPHEHAEEKSDTDPELVEKKWSEAARAAAVAARRKLGGAAGKVVGFAKKNKGKIAAVAGTAAILGAAALASRNPKIRGAVRTAGMQAGVRAGQVAGKVRAGAERALAHDVAFGKQMGKEVRAGASKLGAKVSKVQDKVALGAYDAAGKVPANVRAAGTKVGMAAQSAGSKLKKAVNPTKISLGAEHVGRQVVGHAGAAAEKIGAGASKLRAKVASGATKLAAKLPKRGTGRYSGRMANFVTSSLVAKSMVEKGYYDELPELVELLVVAKSMIEDPEIQKSEYYEDLVANYEAVAELTTEGVEKSNLYEEGYFEAVEFVEKALDDEDVEDEAVEEKSETPEEEAQEAPEEEAAEESGEAEPEEKKPLFGKKQ